MKMIRKGLSVFLSVMMIIGPSIYGIDFNVAYAQPASINPVKTSSSLKPILEKLLDDTTDTNDLDSDGIPDSIERIIGTSPERADSDFDKLSDYDEIMGDLDPLDPDSNHDGLPDYFEVTNVSSLDVDNDGFPNAWDLDNDNDGINDAVDLSPFSKSDVHSEFHVEIFTDRRPTYINFQIKPSNPEHLKLFGKKWDWPDGDDKGAIKDLDYSKEDVEIIPILKINLNHILEYDEAYHQNVIIDENSISILLLPVMEHGNIVAFTARFPYTQSVPSSIIMDVSLVWKVIGINDEHGEDPQEVQLVTYDEDFIISGMTVEEFYGSEVGLFYSADINQSIAANLILEYEFLRSSSGKMINMLSVLEGKNVDVTNIIGSFGHRDEALLGMSNDMIPGALDNLPDDVTLPIIILMEEMSATCEMSEFSGSGNSYGVDLTDKPVLRVKTLKTPWYDTSEKKELLTKDVMEEIHGFSADSEALSVLMSFMLYWNTGEQTLHGAGIPPMEIPDDYSLIPDVAENVASGVLAGLSVLFEIGDGIGGMESFQSTKFLHQKGLPVNIGDATPDELAKLGNFDKFKKWTKQCNVATDNSKFFKYMDDILEGIDIAAIFLNAGFSAYSVIMLAQMSDLSGMQLHSALWLTTMEYYFALAEVMISAIPVVGWIIGLALVISDLIGDWSGELISWLIGLMSDVVYRVTPEIAVVVGSASMDIDDRDGNGVDVGDRITYKSDLMGKIVGNGYYWSLVRRSEILPYYKIFAPSGSGSLTGSLASSVFVTPLGNISLPIPNYSQMQRQSSQSDGWKSDSYEAGAWIEPGTAMVNFPVRIRLDTFYELWYEWKYFVFLVFYAFWQHHDSRTYGINTGKTIVSYVDVMPGNIDDFVSWRGITPLDQDNDGIADDDETLSSPWLYDSDADGLNDKFEIENGMNAFSHDTDNDGLIDWFEYLYGTDPLDSDTDNDGLLDYMEIAGWLIEFDYNLSGRTYVMRVYSDPNVPDTDGDGINDSVEYKSKLNPMSKDTNGDGVNDVADYQEEITSLEFAAETYLNEAKDARDITVGADGFIYVLGKSILYKLDTDLDLISTILLPLEDDRGVSGAQSLVIDNTNGLIHITYTKGYRPAESWISTFDMNGNLIVSQPWAWHEIDQEFNYIGLEIDSQGDVYVLRRGKYLADLLNPVYGMEQYPYRRAYMEKYSSDRELLDAWGQYGELISIDDPRESEFRTWDLIYENDIDDFNDVMDFVLNKKQGNLYICEKGAYNAYLEWVSPDQFGGYWEGSHEKARDDRIMLYDKDGSYARDLYTFNDPVTQNQIAFNAPQGVALDADEYLYMVDKDNIYKFDPNLRPITAWGIEEISESSPAYFYYENLVLDAEKNIYTFCETYGVVPEASLFKVIKYNQIFPEPPDPIQDPVLDRDGDGLTNEEEQTGWDVTFTSNSQIRTGYLPGRVLLGASETQTIFVTSDPLLVDTDSDGLTDLQEFQKKTNPADPDTDDDGIGDFDDSNPLNFDSDFDGIPDGVELTYGSDPEDSDSDNDGLSDTDEFYLNSDPNDNDTDDDGLTDSEEYQAGTNLLNPDSDGDFMFDGKEKKLGTDPLSVDSDNDGLSDGEEETYNTDPMNADSDGDNVADGIEVDNKLDPTSNDTDKDGVSDGIELEQGTDPFNQDSDRDGIPDNLDRDSELPHVSDLIIVADPSDKAFSFIENLKDYTTVKVLTPGELLQDHSGASRIVLVGRPEGDKAVGMLIKNLLSDTGEVLAEMIQSDDNRIVVRHGLWTPTQTIVMLSIPYAQDHLQVLDILRGKIVSIYTNRAQIEYKKSLSTGGSSASFLIDEIDTLKHTDTIVAGGLDEDVIPVVDITRYDTSTIPVKLEKATGLNQYEYAIGQYAAIETDEFDHNVTGAMIKVYYKESSCDSNGDGDVTDSDDIDEATMGLYYFNQTTGMWEKLNVDADWVFDLGVNTNNVELYGENYGGYVWANVAHFSLYGLSGHTFNTPPDISGAYPSKKILWPPNNKFVDVTVEGVTDPDGDAVGITILNITSNEPEDAPKDKNHTPDMYGIGTDTASLRAERLGTGDGRVYEITFIASDGKDGESKGVVNVSVPKKRIKGGSGIPPLF